MNERRPPSPTDAPEENDLRMALKKNLKEHGDLFGKLKDFLDKKDELPEANLW